MIKFDVINRYSGAVQFIAEIDCTDDAPRGIKLGLAVKWAILSGANLTNARLAGAILSGANLTSARLTGADLYGAILTGADLYGADLYGANLTAANLHSADLSGANLTGAVINGRKIAYAATIGCPNGWRALTYVTVDGEQRVQVGCHDKTLAEGRAYWADKYDRREVMAALDYAEALGRIRGCGVAHIAAEQLP